MPNPTDRWLDAEGAAERVRARAVARMTSLSVRKVQELAAADMIPGARKDGDEWTFSEAEVRAWIRRQERRPRETFVALERERRAKKAAAAARAASKMLELEYILGNAIPWPPSGCGIYFLIRSDRVIYVGQSINVAARVAQHVATARFEAWSWVPCRRKGLDALERAYINALLPPLNRDPLTQRMRSSKELERV